MEKLLYGVAYYDEYMPYDRLKKDIQMMKEAGINVVRIAESTWSTLEPQDGLFDFTHIDRVLNAMEDADISVIIGTPTYAIPTWMVKSHPDVLAMTKKGRGLYGARQIMDITHPVYLFYAERIIRKLMEHVAGRACVIGYQLDNETKYYDTSDVPVQAQFVKYLHQQFNGDLDDLNAEFGLDYWSNRINTWEDFPDVRGTINGSLGAEFSKFQRTLVDHFLSWQAAIVDEYKRSDQFVTQNFDFEWRGYSYGVQPSVNQFKASECLSIAGADIYHPTQDSLTGIEIAFGGDFTRSLKKDNYLILETQAQGFPAWVPYDGQLRLQAFSHLASGANSVMYWHWHSIHNSAETYWKGLLSHDFAPNATYLESKTIGKDIARLSPKLVNISKKNHVAILISNESLTALEWFPIDTGSFPSQFKYNDVVRLMYDELYKMNIECDFISPDSTNFTDYKLIVIPALYSAPESLLQALSEYVKEGGNIIATFKTGFSNEHNKVFSDIQPHSLQDCVGISYHQFSVPTGVTLKNHSYPVSPADNQVSVFMELLQPGTAKVLASYKHSNWGKYAAITRNQFGKGTATYLGCVISSALMKEVLKETLQIAGAWETEQELQFPLIIRKGRNMDGKTIRYFFNYSHDIQNFVYLFSKGIELIHHKPVENLQQIALKPWDFIIIETDF